MKLPFDVIVCDHGSGEAADFIAFKEEATEVKVVMYHVKGSGGPEPGDRLADLYEVCGQIVKSAEFATQRSLLSKKLSSRLEGKPKKFRKSNFTTFAGLMASEKPLKVKMVIVQPGVSKKGISTKMASLLSAPDSYLRALGVYEPVEVLCSP